MTVGGRFPAHPAAAAAAPETAIAASSRLPPDTPPDRPPVTRPTRRRPRPHRSFAARRGPARAGLALAAAGLALLSCTSTETTGGRRDFTVDRPRVSAGGVVLGRDVPLRLADLAQAIDELDYDAAGIDLPDPDALAADGPVPPDDPALSSVTGGTAGIVPPFMTAAPGAALDAALAGAASRPGLADELRRLGGQDDPDAPDPEFEPLAAAPIPSGSVRLVALPRMSPVELEEFVELVALDLQSRRGYLEAPQSVVDMLPPPPRGVGPVRTLFAREDGQVRVLRLAARSFASQPPQMWAFGVTAPQVGPLGPSPDLGAIDALVDDHLAAMEAMREGLTVDMLETKVIQLSYSDAPTAIRMLEVLGISTFDEATAIPDEIGFDDLPFVIPIPEPDAKAVGLVGEGQTERGEFGVSLTPSLATDLNQNTIASPMTRLMVLYHPARPAQLGRVRTILDEHVDRPARQIFVEGMVLEISEEGLEDLGIEWELNEGAINWRFGSPRADGQTDTLTANTDDLDFWRVFNREFQWQWSLRIRALLREGRAEVLSRPSVLTLNNRQSTIRVGQDLPIATSQEGTAGNSNRIAFTFKYLPTGILLNIRPRINEDGTEVSMLIDTIVSSPVPNADLEIRSSEGELLATAPTISSRRVQTYARIRNNTPFIIGGLVSRQESTAVDKVPFLGDLPIVGNLFRATRTERTKGEVIIVLTPFILPEDAVNPRTLPKDEDIYDTVGDTLFRDSYRIRSEDVFDLDFLVENRRIRAYRELAQRAIQANGRLAAEEPWRSFAEGRTPGESILVSRMLDEVVRRIDAQEEVAFERVIFFEGERPGGYDIRFVADALARLGGGADWRSFFRTQPDKALAITYTRFRDSEQEDSIRREPVPQIMLVDCPDRERWSDLLWELNRPGPDGLERSTILIQDELDVARLRRAIMLERVVALNGGREQLRLNNFGVGKVLLVPKLEGEQVHVLDVDTARYFFQSEHYYGATLRAVENALDEIDRTMR